MELSIDVQREGDDAVVRLAGELDISTSPDLQDALAELTGAPRRVTIDLEAPECGERLGRAADARRAADERCDILDVVCRGGALGEVLPKRVVEPVEGSVHRAAGAGGVVGASFAQPPGCRDNVVGAARLLHVDRALAEEHYAEHQAKPFFGELVEFITSGPTLAFVLEGEGAIATARTTIGATNPADATPGSLRGDLALAMPDNLVHGSDSPESAAREIALWFPDGLV